MLVQRHLVLTFSLLADLLEQVRRSVHTEHVDDDVALVDLVDRLLDVKRVSRVRIVD